MAGLIVRGVPIALPASQPAGANAAAQNAAATASGLGTQTKIAPKVTVATASGAALQPSTVAAQVAAATAGGLDVKAKIAPHVAVSTASGLALPATTSAVLFFDDFIGAFGAAPNSADWIQHAENNAEIAVYSGIRHSNAFLDGNSHLVLRTQREPGGYLTGGPFSGAWISTFNYGNGWPSADIRHAWNPPYHIEMYAKMPPTPGAWPAGWNMTCDRPTSQHIYELDWAEERMTFPTQMAVHQHDWLNGSDTNPWDGGPVTVTNMGLNFHLFSADVYTDRVEYRVDGTLLGTAPVTSGRQGILLDNVIGNPGSWGSGGSTPDPGDPGPWDMVIDYIRVTNLV